ncbi:50S ribosomal protein L2 [Rozella allomycis CSF55]|uniref:50S ribosomal protein L2 n=1 Tax=Rozella allomycis (strain CSF55) TaxID=988480 RepID=A0A075ASL1_ROZAC|nr:Ribosomal protein L2, bacterial/organellar-type domain-containing protein [Rozella allomycis CSF55]RKP18429.1 50S ribosomal protein L2 [Rozella allomycis CSF55]|eukprot:EPZ33271.1 Ribosomal protein L2, bacterial/organellar-type domain-containing protein [Rozella allomycis CSF55]
MVTDELSYILATNGLKKGQIITNGKEGNEGNMIELKNITDGTTICSIEKVPGSGAIFVRAAGTSATLLSKDLEKEIAYIKMPSGFTKEFHINCRAVIGTVSNPEWQNVDLGKAGKSRHLGIRPSVRGLAMNACDHPNGSSSGRKKNKLPKTKWGKLAKAIGKFYNIKRHFPKYANRKNK